jgi:FkbM family methyltransferase
MKFYSQFQEDEWIVNNIILPQNGFFIEIGCGADGVLHSNTKYFEDLGWYGFLIEADPFAIPEIKKYRSCPVINYAISDKEDYIDFYIYENKEYSSTLRPNDNKISVKTISLKKLLTNLGCNIPIDILSIDTEGSEIDIINGMEDIRPNILIVEYNTDFYRNDVNLITNKLIDLNYDIKHITKCNVIGYHKNTLSDATEKKIKTAVDNADTL